jgi:GNAT superfamily N-acetyltransferase
MGAGAEDVIIVTGRHGAEIVIGPLQPEEHDLLFELFRMIVERAEGFPQAPPLNRKSFDPLWTPPLSSVIAARVDGAFAGAYYLKANFPGRASHIANAGYVVAHPQRGKGVGRALVEDSIRRAPLLGYDAIQFNLVFASNPARALYEELGWREIGRVPDVVGSEEAVIYWRSVGR